MNEHEQQRHHRDILEQHFKRFPLQEITADELERLVGRNYQQRISELRRGRHPMCIELTQKATRSERARYRYRPEPPLGRDPSTPTVGPLLFDLHPRG